MRTFLFSKILIFSFLFLTLTKSFAQDQPDKKKGIDIMITQSPKILVKVEAVTHNVCYGDSKGAINITPSGGYPPYKYIWSNGDSTQDVAGLKAGTYRIAVSDNFSCSDTLTIMITEPPRLNGKVESVKDILCYGYPSGEVDISVSGGKAPYTFNWSTGTKTEDLKGVNSGKYSVLVTDANGCQEIIPAEILEKPLIVRWVDDVTNIKCNGDNTGKIDISVSGGVPPYIYEWSNGSKTEDLREVKAGNYEVVVKDSQGCTEVSLTKVTEPDPITVGFDDVRNLRCNGDEGGVINISVKGGKAPYAYQWNTGATTQDIAGLPAGTYTVNISDNNQCKKTVTKSITEPPLLAVTIANLKNVSFNGGKNGSIDMDVQGGVPPYKYKWSNGSEIQDLSNLPAGSYTLRVNDASGCAKIMTISISQPSPLAVRLDEVKNIACNGTPTGEVNISVSGGVPPYSFAWSSGQTSEDISGLSAGKYSVVVTDANGFKQKVDANLTEPPLFKAQLVTSTDILCNGLHTGAVDIKCEGGVQPYRYRWSNGAVTQDLLNVPAGEYQVKIVDANSCEQALSATIKQPEALAVAFTEIVNIKCADQNTGKIDLAVSGGVAPYKFKWNNGAFTEDIKDIKAGDYNVDVTDSKGCTQHMAATITEPQPLVIKEDVVKNVDCNGNASGSISLNVFGGVMPYVFNWSNGATTKDISTLKAGAYTLKATDANGCLTSFNKTITEPSVIVKKVDEVTNILCFDDAKGAINISVSGGVLPYRYKWSNGAISQDIINVKAGRYRVSISDANGCTDSLSAVITQNPLLTADVNVNNIKCFGDKTGNISLSVQGGVAPYAYKWSNGAITQNISGLSTGKFSTIITDAKGCIKTVDAEITQPSKFVAALDSEKEISCFGDASGSVSIRVSGGTKPYKYKWSNGDSIQNISKLVAGTYSLLATDANGCTQSVRTTLSQPTNIDHAVKSISHVNCNGDNSGSIDITIQGGVGPYSYKWSNGATSQDLDGVAAGKYSVTITDANACVKTLSAEITQPQLLSVKMDTVLHILCFGDRKGAIKLNVSGGVAPYKYSWSNGAITKDITDQPAGTYSCTVTDMKGCSKTITVTINQPAPLTASVKESKNILCYGDKTGAITLEISGGAKPYTYKWNNGSTTQNLSNVSAGSYTVEIVDKNGCRQTLSSVISQPARLVSSLVSAKNISCAGGKDGVIDIMVVGGTTPYQYKWNNGATSQDAVDVAAGKYNVLITDANGCKDSTISLALKEPAMLNASVGKVTNVLKYGEKTGAITLTVDGGVVPYAYSWSNGAVTQNLINVPGGNYSVKVKDANGCEKTVNAVINQPPALAIKIESVRDIKCNGERTGAINIAVSGGASPYKFYWSNGDSTRNLENVGAGDYSVKVTDANGYHQTVSSKIAEPSPLMIKNDLLKNLLCNSDNSGAINVSVTGGIAPYKYAWSSGQTTEDISKLPSGTYQLKVTDVNNCAAMVENVIQQPPVLAATVAEVRDVNCKGEHKGEVMVDVQGGVAPYNYFWSNGERSKDLTRAVAGQYSLKVVDANGCISNANATIREPELFVAKVSSVIHNNCFGEKKGAIKVDVAGGTQPYNFRWSNGDSTQNLSGIAKGSYALTVTDAKSCQQKVTAIIEDPASMKLQVKELLNVSCFGDKTGRVRVDVAGGTKPYNYKWNNGTTTADLLGVNAGDYQLIVKDAKGCKDSIVANVIQPDQLTVMLDTVKNVLCNGDKKGSVEISVAGGVLPYTYVWSNGANTKDLSTVGAGKYSVIVSDAKGCNKTVSTSINEPAALTVKAETVSNIKCSGDSTGMVSLTTSGGLPPYRYLWNNGATEAKLTNLTAGNYTATVTDVNNCNLTYNVSIAEPEKLITTIDAITDIRCYGDTTGSIMVTVREGVAPYAFKWSNGATTEDIKGLVAGDYKLNVTEGNGCITTLEATIESPDKFTTSLDNVEHIKCYGDQTGSIDISVAGGVPPYHFGWSNGMSNEDLRNLFADSYSVVVADANGCSKTIHTEVQQPSKLAINIDSVKNVKCCGDNSGAIFISVNGGVKPYKYEWSNGAITEDIQNLVLGVYTVNVTDANGCVVSSLDEMNLYEQVVSKGKFTTRDILFDVGKATIKAESFNTINRIASFMKEHPDMAFRIEGHTDSDGTDEANQKLSEDRAYAIRSALIKFGIRENRLQAKGWGESKPIATNLTAEGKSLNRRVEFVSLTGTIEGTLAESIK